MKVGLALSGGGTRGLVHVGVMQALLESGIEIDAVSGTSAGAIIGALYAAGHSPAEILTLAREQSLIRIFNLRMPSKGFARHRFLRKQLSEYLPDNSFEQLVTPFYVTVANISAGVAETYHSGPLIDLVIASSSIPVLFEPIVINGNTYVDGGLMMNLPASPLRDQCDVLIGVNLVPQISVPDSDLKSVFGIGSRCFDLAALNNIKPELKLCDVVIEPHEISRFSRFTVTNVEKVYQIGYDETTKHIARIKQCLSQLGKM